MWSGRQWGTFFLPRIGMEVIVDFMEGDPDRPFVSGCLYNADNMPPYPLPDNATRTTIKTNSSKGGGGFNELRFEDKKGAEQVFIHAQKDLEVRVGNVTSMSTVAEEHRTVGSDRMTAIAKQEHLSVGKIRFTGIGEDDHLDIGRDQVTEVGSDAHFTAGKNSYVESGTEIHVKAGATLVLEAGVTISIKAGPSSVVIGPGGVTIDGPLVKINSGGSPKPAKKPEKPDPAKKPKEAIKDKPGQVSNAIQRKQAQTLRTAAKHAIPFCAECEADK
jgi:type VI secretion system secreted protein VgrG